MQEQLAKQNHSRTFEYQVPDIRNICVQADPWVKRLSSQEVSWEMIQPRTKSVRGRKEKNQATMKKRRAHRRSVSPHESSASIDPGI
jgi:hypothetical protein